MSKKLNPGDQAPPFNAPATTGNNISLSDCAGKRLILYFYPKDNTPGCTLEAQNFAKIYKKLTEANVILLGVSRETITSHNNFAKKCALSFPLLSDTESKLCSDYGVLKEKSMFGRKYMGIERSTFLIDERGKIIKIWRKVSVSGHAEEVWQAIAEV